MYASAERLYDSAKFNDRYLIVDLFLLTVLDCCAFGGMGIGRRWTCMYACCVRVCMYACLPCMCVYVCMFAVYVCMYVCICRQAC